MASIEVPHHVYTLALLAVRMERHSPTRERGYSRDLWRQIDWLMQFGPYRDRVMPSIQAVKSYARRKYREAEESQRDRAAAPGPGEGSQGPERLVVSAGDEDAQGGAP